MTTPPREDLVQPRPAVTGEELVASEPGEERASHGRLDERNLAVRIRRIDQPARPEHHSGGGADEVEVVSDLDDGLLGAADVSEDEGLPAVFVGAFVRREGSVIGTASAPPPVGRAHGRREDEEEVLPAQERDEARGAGPHRRPPP